MVHHWFWLNYLIKCLYRLHWKLLWTFNFLYLLTFPAAGCSSSSIHGSEMSWALLVTMQLSDFHGIVRNISSSDNIRSNCQFGLYLYLPIQLFVTSTEEVLFSPVSKCLSVGWFVSRITKQLLHSFQQNLAGWWILAQNIPHNFLVLIQIKGRIQEFSLTFFILAR